MRKLVLVVVTLALAAPVVAYAGGWATVKLSSTPKGLTAGQPWALRMTVLQHGVTPLADVQPHVRIEQGTLARQFLARPTKKTGVYRARVVFPRAGTWRWSIWDGFSRTHTYKAVRIAPSAI